MSNHTREAEINHRFDIIESKLAALEKLIKSNPVSEASASLNIAVTHNTPINTIVTYDNEMLFFKGTHDGAAKVSHDILSDDYFIVDIGALSIDITADLKFRLFLNSPAGYDWGMVLPDGTGVTCGFEPELGRDSWVGARGVSKKVGYFSQYKDIWKQTKVHRGYK